MERKRRIYGLGKLKRDPEGYSDKRGPLAAQEHIQELIRLNPDNVDKIIELPKECDLGAWQYEHIRQFLMEANILVTHLQAMCNETNCPIMRVNNDSYKCTVHDKWRDCSAIDYMVHNLDSSTELLLNFKSLVVKGKVPESELIVLHQILRRLYRVFAHTIYAHSDLFWKFEHQTFLYKRFFHFSKKFNINHKEKLVNPFV